MIIVINVAILPLLFRQADAGVDASFPDVFTTEVSFEEFQSDKLKVATAKSNSHLIFLTFSKFEVEVINEGPLNFRKSTIGVGSTISLSKLISNFDSPFSISVDLLHQTRKVAKNSILDIYCRFLSNE